MWWRCVGGGGDVSVCTYLPVDAGEGIQGHCLQRSWIDQVRGENAQSDKRGHQISETLRSKTTTTTTKQRTSETKTAKPERGGQSLAGILHSAAAQCAEHRLAHLEALLLSQTH